LLLVLLVVTIGAMIYWWPRLGEPDGSPARAPEPKAATDRGLNAE